MQQLMVVSGVLMACLFVFLAGCNNEGDRASRPAEQAEPKPGPEPEPAEQKPPAADARPVVVIETSMGDIRVELDPGKAPVTVENFLRYVDDRFYDGTIFHRVARGFVIQGGGFTERMQKKPTRPPIRNEADNGLRNERSTVAMARTGDLHSATSQFYVSVKDNADLDHRGPGRTEFGYCVFGRVVEGMDVVDRIDAVPTGVAGGMSDVPRTPVVIKTIRRAAGG